jgi:hypothetical protein
MSKGSDNIVQLADRFAARSVSRMGEGLLNQPKTPYGGGGGDDGMSERIARLEASVGHIQADITQLRSDVSGLKSDIGDVKSTLAAMSAKLDSKVDYKWLTIYIMGIVAVILREEIAALFG